MSETGDSIPTIIGAPTARVEAALQPDGTEQSGLDLVADLRRARRHAVPAQD